MSAHTVKSNPSSVKGENQGHRDRELKDMISALTSRLSDLHHVNKLGSSHHLENEEEHGAGIITLAGTNVGATMRGDLLGRHEKDGHDDEDFSGNELEGLDTYVNSNFQAVNNSIMLNASYSANDPGVHMDITDVIGELGSKHSKPGHKGSKKGKEVAHGHGNAHSEFSE